MSPRYNYHGRDMGMKWFSQSKLNLFRQCPLKYYYRYILGIKPDKVPPWTIRGVVLDQVSNDYYEHKAVGEEWDLDTVMRAWDALWEEKTHEGLCDWRGCCPGGMDPVAQRGYAREGMEVFYNEVLQEVDPAPGSVQQSLEMAFSLWPSGAVAANEAGALGEGLDGERLPEEGVKAKFVGTIDLMNTRGHIIDNKCFSKSKKGELTGSGNLQPLLYAAMAARGTGSINFEWHVCIINKTVPCKTDRYKKLVTPKMQEGAVKRAIQTARAIDRFERLAMWYPDRSSEFCSEMFCDFWERCHREWGD